MTWAELKAAWEDLYAAATGGSVLGGLAAVQKMFDLLQKFLGNKAVAASACGCTFEDVLCSVEKVRELEGRADAKVKAGFADWLPKVFQFAEFLMQFFKK